MNLAFHNRLLFIVIGMACGAIGGALVESLWAVGRGQHPGVFALVIGMLWGGAIGYVAYDTEIEAWGKIPPFTKTPPFTKISPFTRTVLAVPAMLVITIAVFFILFGSYAQLTAAGHEILAFMDISEKNAGIAIMGIVAMFCIANLTAIVVGLRHYWPTIPVSGVALYYTLESKMVSLAAIIAAYYFCSLFKEWSREAGVRLRFAANFSVSRGTYVLRCGLLWLFRALRVILTLAFVLGSIVAVVWGIAKAGFFIFLDEEGYAWLIPLIAWGILWVYFPLVFGIFNRVATAFNRAIAPVVEEHFPWWQEKWQLNFPDDAIYAALDQARRQCPFFHTEADFRTLLASLLSEKLFDFAEALSKKYPDEYPDVRDEVPIRMGAKECIDIVINGRTAIELKYLPVKLSAVCEGTEYKRRDFDSRDKVVKVENDISRLQGLVDDPLSKIQRGFVVVVTNSNILLRESYDWREWHKFSDKENKDLYYAVIPVSASVGD